MKLVVDHVLDATPTDVFSVVADLGRYPTWMGLVHSADIAGDEAWSVQLRGRIGPLARSKRLTMRRTGFVPGSRVRFERDESDGRSHGEWILDVTVEPDRVDPERTRLVMVLRYGGRLWSSVVEKVLHDEIEASKARLDRLVSG